MAAKVTRLTHKIALQLHLVVESCIISSSRSRRPFPKLLDTPSYSLHPRSIDAVLYSVTSSQLYCVSVRKKVFGCLRAVRSSKCLGDGCWGSGNASY